MCNCSWIGNYEGQRNIEPQSFYEHEENELYLVTRQVMWWELLSSLR